MTQAVTDATQSAEPSADSGRQAIDVRVGFERLKQAFRGDPYPSYETRLEWLRRLEQAIRRNQDEIVQAVNSDFGMRSSHETKLAEVFTPLSAIKYIRSQLKKWMQPESRHVSLTFKPATAKVHRQPLGVVGVIAPWNYPFQLAVEPIAYALAAGNRVYVKPSEYTPRVSELLKRLMTDSFDAGLVEVVTGGPEVGDAFSRLPFDHLLFTGSTAVGRKVMQAAAENLVPVTLELGGKSPTIVHESYPTDKASARIASGKLFNAGQTCIAPDYLLVPDKQIESFVDELTSRTTAYYPTLANNVDYTSIISDRHFQRLQRLVDDAVAKGARKIEVNPAAETLDGSPRRLAPTLLLDVTDEMTVMQEEIFGPILPIVGYRTLRDAIDYVNARPRPLALYYFDEDKARARRVLEHTISGGAGINEVVLHFSVDDMPFGGVGPSGMGAYHGKEGFDTFSHKKGVLYQAKWNATGLLAPPYGDRINKMLKMLIGN